MTIASCVVAEQKGGYNTEKLPQRWVEVLVDCPGVQGLFTYSVPEDLEVQAGDIVSVPFGNQVTGGIAIQLLSQKPLDLDLSRIKEIDDVITSGFFPPTYWELLNRVAAYYCTELLTVIRGALPPGLLQRSQRRVRLQLDAIPPGAEQFCSFTARKVLELLQQQKTGDYSVQYLKRQIRGADRALQELRKRGWLEIYLEVPKPTRPKLQKAVTLIADEIPSDLTARQQEIYQVLRHEGGELWLNELLQKAKTSSATVQALADKGYVVIQEQERLRLLQEAKPERDQIKVLTNAQSCALEAIKNLDGYAEVLLHGVTGSGKTEVYLQAIAPILAQGQSALVLVPEIGLTPQLTDRFRARFGDKVLVYHSGLSDGERYDTWRMMLLGEPLIVIGTRSAVFAPLPKLGLIILDEEHDSSFKQSQPAPCYHARKVAQWRSQLVNCPLILGSATPSLSTWVEVGGDGFTQRRKACPERSRRDAKGSALSDIEGWEKETENTQYSEDNRYYISLPQRIQERPLPPITIIDLRRELKQGNRSIFSQKLQNSLASLQNNHKQGILFIPRRGHSTFVSCRSCGYVIECPHCDVSLSYHYTHEGATELLRCHYCNHSSLQPRHCPECNSPYFKHFGSGTQKVMQALEQEFPELRCLRFDSDTTRTKGAHRQILEQFTQGEADLLVGTQMLTKGLDIAQVTLVGVVAADGLLHRADYHAAEKAFQTLTQVAGRAGRGDEPGEVIIQTYNPEHPVIEAVKKHDYLGFAETELEQRQALGYPPYGHLILIRLSGLKEQEVETTANAIALYCSENINPEVEILGPAPATIMRVANRYRWQILLKFPLEMPPQFNNWQQLRGMCPQGVSCAIDVDPLNLD